MGKINVLDFQVANLIAAGEVVERPASAVKELLENAMDADATMITVEIKKGGVTFIRVTDNGGGMSADDLPISIKRHATSKIRSATDLDGITTLGFRGEALAAISSVSNLRIMTKRGEDLMGSLLVCENGQITELSEVGCPNGTTVIVEELFANVPARRKFLKKDQSEAMAVTAVVEKLALSRPDIQVKLIIDGNLRFQTAGDSKIRSAIYAVLGREFASKLIEVDSMTEGIRVNGFIGRPDNVRSNRNNQYFFLNGRTVRSKTATAALEQAFESYLETEKFPCAVLYIYVHPTFVDVNVHPTKLEVKFSNERLVFEGIFCAVRNALMQATDRPSVLLEPSQMTAEQHSVYNAFVPVYDRIADGTSKNLTGSQLFDSIPDDPDESIRPPKNGSSVEKPTPSTPHQPTASASDEVRSTAFSDGRPVYDDSEAPPERTGRLPDLSNLYNGLTTLPDIDIPGVSIDGDVPSQPPANPTDEKDNTLASSDTDNTEKASLRAPEWMSPEVAEQWLGILKGGDDPSTQDVSDDTILLDPTLYESEELSPSEDEISTEGSESPPSAASTEEDDSSAVTGGDSPTSEAQEQRQSKFLFSLSDKAKFEGASKNDYRMLGTAFRTYIFVEFCDHILIIDKHAAHERILFERMKQILRAQSGDMQMLLVPSEIKLTAEEFDAVCDYESSIRAIGFEFTLDQGSIILKGIPSLLDCDRSIDLFITLAGRLANGTGDVSVTRDSFFEEALYQGSCKAAVKAGRDDSEEHMKWIVDVLMQNPEIICCPHGRPVALRLTKHDIEHFFKRI